MRYDDLSQAATGTDATTLARADIDALPAGSLGPESGNTITGTGTITGVAGADSVANPPAQIISVQGAGGASQGADGSFQVAGQFGILTINADGSYSYIRSAGVPDGVQDVFTYTMADQSGQQSSSTLTIQLVAEPAEAATAAAANIPGIVTLPPGVELSDIRVVGRDLVITLPDGSEMVIPGGAVFVPQLVIGDVEVPASNLAALLIESEPQPAAGPLQSSGGNFEVDVPPLDPGVPLGDLLPPTVLAFPEPTFEEPTQFIDREPTVVIVTPDNPAGAVNATDSVDESGLPARGSEPEGTLEPQDIETTSGTIVFTAEDGFESITINGVAVTSVGQEIAGAEGVLTITSIDLASGEIGYTYTVTDNTTDGVDDFDDFTVIVTDSDGDTATATLHIDIADDEPIAEDDTDVVDIQTNLATGNVITGADTTSGAAGADTVGADDAQLTAVSSVNVAANSDDSFDGDGNLVVEGEFGTLTIDAEGNYSYALNADAPGGSVEVFEYTLTDGDGDPVTATLTITNPDQQPETGPNAAVQLDDDALAGGNPGGSGDDPNAVNTTGTLSGSGGDGALTFALLATGAPAGFSYVLQANGDLFVMQGGTHVLTVTVDSSSGDYSVSQVNPIDHPAGSAENNVDFTINYTVTDSDGDVANGTLDIDVDDDTPLANNDTDSVDLQTEIATGNVITGSGTNQGTANADSPGADGFVRVTAIASNNVPANSDSSADGSGDYEVAGEFGTLTINEDGSYSYQLNDNAPGGSTDVFTYTYVDGDGDTVSATLTINNPDQEPEVDAPDVGAAGTIVDEKGLPERGGEPAGTGEIADGDGTDNDDTSETSSVGTITFDPGNAPATVEINGVVVTGAGQVIAGAHGSITIQSYDPNGSITYTYTLADNVDNTVVTGDTFTVEVTDSDGDVASDSFTVVIIDDAPIAEDDTDSITSGDEATGNVITAVGTTNSGADTPGADNALAIVGLSGFGGSDNSSAGGGFVVVGEFGTLTMQANGDYSYVRFDDAPDGETDTFTYTVEDGDGSTDTATLTITINNELPTVNAPDAEAPGTIVDEKGLPERGGEPAGTGEIADGDGTDNDDTSETSSVGTITFTPGDPPPVVTINDVVVTGAGQEIAGDHGTLTIVSYDPDGTITYTYTLADNVDNTVVTGDTFDVVVTDSDGQEADDSFTVVIIDDAPIAEDDTDEIVEGSGTSAEGNVITAVGTTNDGEDTPGADNALEVVGLSGNGSNDTNPAGGFVIVGVYGTITMQANGSYVYNLSAAGQDALNDLADGEQLTDTFTYTVEDGDGSTDTADLVITLTGSNDAPVVGSDAAFVSDEGTPGGIPDTHGDPTDAADTTDSDTDSGQISISDPDGDSVTVTLTNPPAGLEVNGQPVTWSGSGTNTLTATATIDGVPDTLVMTITIDNDGNWTVDQDHAIDHPDPGEDTMSFDVTVNVDDGTTSTDGTLTINVEDDQPVIFTPEASEVENDDGTGGGDLDVGDPDGVDDNYGADGPGTVRFPASLEGDDSGLKSNGQPIVYHVSEDGHTLTAYVENGDDEGFQDGDDDTIFTITLDPDASTWSIVMEGHVDSTTDITFSDLLHDFVGGNDAWAGFVPNDQVDGKAGDAPVDDDSQDLLLTPLGTGTAVNGNANSAGTTGPIAGQNIGDGEGMRLDFVVDLTGVPTPGDYNDASEQTHDFDSHYLVNGAVLTFGDGTSDQTTASFKAILVTDDVDDDGVADPVSGTGETLVSVTSIAIAYDGVTVNVDFDPGDPTTPQVVVVGDGDDLDGLADRTYTVTFVEEGGEWYAEVTGIYDDEVQIATFAEQNYNALELLHLGPPDADADFAITGFGAAAQSTDPVPFSVPVEIVDADGDVVAGDNIDITIVAELSEAEPLSAQSTSSMQSMESSSLLVATNDNVEAQKTLSSANNAIVYGAIAAAGLAAVPAAAADYSVKSGLEPMLFERGFEGAKIDFQVRASEDGDSQALAGGAKAAIVDKAPADSGASSSTDEAQSLSVADQQSAARGPSELSHGTEAPQAAAASTSALTADAVMMPSAEMLAQADAGASGLEGGAAAQHNQVVGKVLADSLTGGGADDGAIDAALGQLPNHSGGFSGLEVLASVKSGAVPGWDGGEGFAIAGRDVMFSMEMMMLHQDAPAANG